MLLSVEQQQQQQNRLSSDYKLLVNTFDCSISTQITLQKHFYISNRIIH